jgi:hypothetical protein
VRYRIMMPQTVYRSRHDKALLVLRRIHHLKAWVREQAFLEKFFSCRFSLACEAPRNEPPESTAPRVGTLLRHHFFMRKTLAVRADSVLPCLLLYPVLVSSVACSRRCLRSTVVCSSVEWPFGSVP